ncbi:DNA kinase/phosphatase Pnk1 [Coemansia javaensis]|uniref:DNA kinase/phosphatase Pnk1 n=1 Tax=Coemansia javaensis TaxID=2761396 RepID=A0A9W8H8Q3_9FUNG|nr:DNA kinase/phosphatase Pnk1 [Coemansia javaensis]
MQHSIGNFFPSKRTRATGGGGGGGGEDVQWGGVGATWIGKWGAPKPAARLAAFDLDATLICVKGRSRFPRDSDDWRLFHPSVPLMLRRLHQQGYRIVVLSNQNGLRPGKNSVGLSKGAKEFRLKIAKVARVLDVPFTIVVATEKDYMRKPSPGMWHLAELDNGGIAVDRSASFFVGDAAGRPDGWKPGEAADFSDSDLAFALNVGVPFYTPDELFTDEAGAEPEPLALPKPRQWDIARFAPAKLPADPDAHARLLDAIREHVGQAKEAGRGLLVVLVGPPACGKSTFARTHLEPLGAERVNMDELKTRNKCVDAVRSALAAGRCAVVDNTSPDAAARSPFVALAGECGAARIAVVFEHASRDLALHNNNFRAQLAQARYLSAPELSGAAGLAGVPDAVGRVPEVAYHGFYKRLELPTAAEGFDAVLQHAFVPAFDSADDERLWNQFL